MNVHVFATMLFFIVGCQSWGNQYGYQTRVGRGVHKSNLLKNFLWPFARPETRTLHPVLTFREDGTSGTEELPVPTAESCMAYDENPIQCRKEGCFYCCSDTLCYLDESDAPDCILTPDCTNYCGDLSLCSAQGCNYSRDTRGCYGDIQNRKFSGNMCGRGQFSEDGVWHNALVYSYPIVPDELQPVIFDDKWGHYCYSNFSIEYEGRPLSSVYQTQLVSVVGYNVAENRYEAGFSFEIPVLDGGKYMLVTRFAELWSNVTRQMGISIGLNRTETFPINTTTLGKPVVHKLMFEVSDDLETFSYNGINDSAIPMDGSIYDHFPMKYASVWFEVFANIFDNNDYFIDDNYIPFLNAFYIEKLD